MPERLLSAARHRSAVSPRRPGIRGFVTLLSVLALSSVVAVPADAVVVCQRKNTLRLRAGPECKKKEQKIVDLAAFALASRLQLVESTLASRVQRTEAEIGIGCAGAPERAIAELLATGPVEPNAGCRALDGNPEACARAYETRFATASSCFYWGASCMRCNGQYGACIDACHPSSCPGAPTRVFRGAADSGACEVQPTQADCEASWAFDDEWENFYPAPVDPTTCFWIAAQATCRACALFQEADGVCTNGCVTPAWTCAGRPGLPTDCFGATTQAECEQSWTIYDELLTSCFWDPVAADCYSCDATSDFLLGLCDNEC